MTPPKWFWCVLSACLFIGCASAKSRTYDPAAITAIRQWYVGFNYAGGRIEKTTTDAGDSVTKVVESGMPREDLQFRDDVFFGLQDKHGLSVVRTRTTGSGMIGLTIGHHINRSGGDDIMQVDVQLYNTAGEVIGRVRVTNGNRNGTFKHADEFAEYTAKEIAKVFGK